jgi:3',5'-cyclic AMP phosphodiesterase CpdA
MVRVLAVSDEVSERLWAGHLPGPPPDVVAACGDLPAHYLAALADRFDVPLVLVPGNHDPERLGTRASRSGLLLRAGMPVPDPPPLGAVDVDVAVADVAGLRFAGLGGCVRYRPGPHQYTQREHDRRARRLMRAVRRRQRSAPGPVDVLLTHAPPLGLGDEDDAAHTGIRALHGVLAALTPRWHLHGHVHPHGRRRPDRAAGATTVCNVVPFRVLDVTPGAPLGRPSPSTTAFTTATTSRSPGEDASSRVVRGA